MLQDPQEKPFSVGAFKMFEARLLIALPASGLFLNRYLFAHCYLKHL